MNKDDEKWLDFIYAIDEARFIRTVRTRDNEILAILVWHGGHTIHIHNSDGKEVDVWNVGDFAKEEVPFDLIEEEMEIIANEILIDWYDGYPY